MSLMSFSQKNSIKYPKTVIIEGDTITMFTFTQAKILATEVTERDFLLRQTALDGLQIDVLNKKINNLKKQLELVYNQNKVYSDIIVEKNIIISKQEDIIKLYIKKEKRAKIKTGIYTSAGVAILVGVLLISK